MHRPAELDRIVVRAQKGESNAFDEIVSSYRERLAGFFRVLAFDRRRAEELAQDTLSHLFEKLSRYDPRGTFEAWLFSVARHLAIDAVRRDKIRRQVAVGDAQEWLPAEARLGSRAFPQPGESLERAETVEIVRRALDKVPTVYRETLVLADIDHVPYERIAAQQNTSVGTVKSRVFRGRAALAQALDRTRSRQRLETLVA